MPADCCFPNPKNGLIHHGTFTTREDAKAANFSDIKSFYNRQRIHQKLGYTSPQHFEEHMACPQ